MAAVIAAVAILAARSSLLARAAVIALISVHSVWGLHIFTLSRSQQNFRELMQFFVAATTRGVEAGMGAFKTWQAIGKSNNVVNNKPSKDNVPFAKPLMPSCA
jgi:hypothetical protein